MDYESQRRQKLQASKNKRANLKHVGHQSQSSESGRYKCLDRSDKKTNVQLPKKVKSRHASYP